MVIDWSLNGKVPPLVKTLSKRADFEVRRQNFEPTERISVRHTPTCKIRYFGYMNLPHYKWSLDWSVVKQFWHVCMTWKLFSIFRIAGIFPYLVSKQQRPLAARWQQPTPSALAGCCPSSPLSLFSKLAAQETFTCRARYYSLSPFLAPNSAEKTATVVAVAQKFTWSNFLPSSTR